MNRLLHIIATPRGESSRTLSVSRTLIKRLQEKNPQLTVEEFNVFSEKLPELHAETISGKYLLMGGKNLPPELIPLWKEIENHINRFQAVDTILFSTPMWNFGMPYKLKHYFDVILQPRYLFRYTENGVEGLAKGKKVFIVSTRGGDYSETSPVKSYDHLEPHLRTVLGFIGITDITSILVQPMDAGPQENGRKLLEDAYERVRRL